MARADRRRAKSTKPHAAVASRGGKSRPPAVSYEDTMFFPRLRRHAKWMFVFLALVFGLGFVVFGVGAGGTGIGDLFRSSGGTSDVPSISKARKQTEQSPKNAQAWRDLSTALQTEGQTNEAVQALSTYISLKPKEPDALRELAGLYLSQATEQQNNAQIAQLQAAYAGASQNYAGSLTTADGRAVTEDPIGRAINAKAAAAINAAVTAAQTALANTVATYRRLVKLQPTDPNVRLELAQAAQQANDVPTAIGAYEEFLRLAPDDSSAAIVKQQLKQLRAASRQATPSAGASG